MAGFCDGVDLNIGCPQHIARRGQWGAFLMKGEWSVIRDMITSAKQYSPITAKIRVFDSIEETVTYAKYIAASGISALTVHGRTIDQKRDLTGIASWSHISAVKSAVTIPLISNGNIRYFEDVSNCLQVTKCDAVMAAEGLLSNPSLFDNKVNLAAAEAEEFIRLFQQDPGGAALSSLKSFLFRVWKRALLSHQSMRDRLETCGQAYNSDRHHSAGFGIQSWQSQN